MTMVHALVLGMIEGLTEFLPVSSTFHLIWASRLLGLPQTEFQKLFEVVIQSGAVLAILFLYAKTVVSNKTLLIRLGVSFLPTASVGLILYKLIKGMFFEHTILQGIVFALVGVLFLIYERVYGSRSPTKINAEISYRDALIVGLLQAVSVVPGVSRAGAVMLAMMYVGVNRREAAIYSFLLAVPTIMAASLLDLVKTYPMIGGNAEEISLLAVGFIAAFMTAIAVVRWFVGFMQQHSLAPFGWYRLAATFLFFIR